MIYNYLRKTLLAGLMLGCVAVANAAGTDVKVFLKSGKTDVVTIDETGFIYFQDNTMNVLPTEKDNAPVSFALSNIQKLVFGETTGSPRILGAGEVVLFPTVATSQVFLANAPASIKQVQVVDMAGKVVLSSAYQTGQAIEIGNLATGVYILKADGATFKFQKK